MKKIRFKFFIIAAASLFLVLFSIIFSFNISNKVRLTNDAKEISYFILNATNYSTPGGDLPGGDPEALFRSRFFIATYSDGKLTALDTSKVARITTSEATNLANKIYASNSKEGFDGIYYYSKSNNSSLTNIIFLDRQMELENYSKSLTVSSLIATGGYIITLVLIYIASFIVFKPVEEAAKKQKRFITDASHELKTPLTIINSNLSLIEIDSGASEYTDAIKMQTDRLTKMTNELVLLSKLNEDGFKLNISDIDIDSLLEETAHTYVPILKEKGIELHIDLSSNYVLKGDALLLSQLFYSLFDNMTKYASNGDAYIKSKKLRNNVEIIFQNKIEPNSNIDSLAIFDRFYKSDESRHSIPNSFGIGLSMAKAITETHKGKISASIQQDNIIFKIIL